MYFRGEPSTVHRYCVVHKEESISKFYYYNSSKYQVSYNAPADHSLHEFHDEKPESDDHEFQQACRLSPIESIRITSQHRDQTSVTPSLSLTPSITRWTPRLHSTTPRLTVMTPRLTMTPRLVEKVTPRLKLFAPRLKKVTPRLKKKCPQAKKK